MKRIFYVLGVAALAAMTVVSCNKPAGNNSGWDNVTVDGFYVVGEAIGSTQITDAAVMAGGFNEVTKAARDGMFEKYVVLEGGKEFYLVYNDGGKKTRYSAELKEFSTPTDKDAYGENPEKVLKGALQSGETAPAMKAAETGLYHIVLDLNKSGDLDNAGGAQILLLNATKFGPRGAMNGWGFTEGTPDKISNDGMKWEFKDQSMSPNAEFKFATGNYWKVTLDDAGKVKAEVSLAEGMTVNGSNLKVEKGGMYTITLNYKMAAGATDRNFSYTAVWDRYLQPQTFVVGLSGGNLPESVGAWSDPNGASLAVFNQAESTVGNDANGFDGTYVWDIKNIAIGAGEMKVRANGGWYGVGSVTVNGINHSGSDNFVIADADAGNYSVKFTIKWKDCGQESFTAVFTKK